MIFKKYFDPILLIFADTLLLFTVFTLFFNSSGTVITEQIFNFSDQNLINIFIAMNVVYWLIIYIFKGVFTAKANSSRLDILIQLFKVQLYGTFLLVIFPALKLIISRLVSDDQVIDFSLFNIVFAYFFSVYIITSSFHLIYFSLRKYLLRFNIGKKKVYIIGFEDHAKDIISTILADDETVFDIIGIVSEDKNDIGKNFKGIPVVEAFDNIHPFLDKNFVNDIIIGFPIESEEFYKLRMELSQTNISFFISADIKDMMKGYVKTHQLVGMPLIELLPDHMPYWEVKAKRLLDIIFSFFVLTLGAPFILLLGLLVKLTSKGPMFYSQERLGFHGKPYFVHKFRTMYTDAEAKSGPVWAGEDDPRITPFGKLLRKTRMDELQNLWCIPSFFRY